MHGHSTKNYGLHWLFFFFCTRPFDQNIWSPFIYSLLQTTIRPKNMVLFNLFLLFTHDNLTKIYGLLSFIVSFVQDHSNDHDHDDLTKNYGPHWFIFFICKRPFDRNIWSSFIYLFYLHTTVRQIFMVFFHLFFLLQTTIQPNYMVFFHLFFL